MDNHSFICLISLSLYICFFLNILALTNWLLIEKLIDFKSYNTNFPNFTMKYQNFAIKHIRYIRENYYMFDILKMYFSREYCFIPVSHKASMPWKAFRIKPGEQIIFSKIVTLHGINIYIELMRYVFLIRHTHAWV